MFPNIQWLAPSRSWFPIQSVLIAIEFSYEYASLAFNTNKNFIKIIFYAPSPPVSNNIQILTRYTRQTCVGNRKGPRASLIPEIFFAV